MLDHVVLGIGCVIINSFLPIVPSEPLVRPNRLSDGGGWSNVENAITQPVWLLAWHAGTCLKSPPTSEPFLTSTLPPIRIAEISSLRTAGLESTCLATSWRSTNEPCEWPISTNPRPWLYFFR